MIEIVRFAPLLWEVSIYLEDASTHAGRGMLIIFDFAVNFGLKNYKCEWDFARIFIGYTNHGGVSDLGMGKEVTFEFCWSDLEPLDLDDFLTREA